MHLRLLHVSAIALLAACGTGPSPTAASANNAAVEQSAPAEATRGSHEFTVSEVATFSTPWAMEFLPASGGRNANMALVTEREGNLWLVDVTSGQRQQVSGVPSVRVAGQGGLGDVVVHPEFAGNRRIYLSYAEAGPNETAGAALGYGTLVIGQGQPRIEGFRVIWRQMPKVTGNGHFAHRMVFAPDGHLFVTSGDREKMQPAQDMASDLGKIMRMTAEGEPVPGGPYADRGGRAAYYWSIGHRNPLGIAFAPDGRLWSSEMGPRHGDELNLILPGRNYGWPEASYGSHYRGGAIPDEHAPRGFEEPKLWWTPAISPGGLLIYTGDLFPRWRGNAFVPGLSGQNLVRVELDGERAREAERWGMNARIRAVEQGPRGEIYLLEDGRSPGKGRLLRLEPRR
ncbi:MAG TPA: PQQ-dependent sugar dehydrogenase [Sphingomicrobium sp.]|nr:PQQ-dependent sugar dehydrogenase [Sphingomicrobium sp.]